MPLESSPEQPLPVRTVARALADWIGRLGRVWVEGQVTEVSRRGGASRCFFVLRDTAAQMSLQISSERRLVDELSHPPAEGARVVVWVKAEVYAARGSLTLAAYAVRQVSVVSLHARIEALRAMHRV